MMRELHWFLWRRFFYIFYEKENLQYNLVIALTAEEEISGFDGIEALCPPITEY